MTSAPGTAPDRAQASSPSQRRDRTHWLYVAVIVAVALGIGVGLLAPETGKALKPLGTAFVDLIRMMISPVIFCTIVLGIGSVRSAASVAAPAAWPSATSSACRRSRSRSAWSSAT